MLSSQKFDFGPIPDWCNYGKEGESKKWCELFSDNASVCILLCRWRRHR